MNNSIRKIRSVFISDVHLGSKHARVDLLLDFLKWIKHQNPEKLYIVGDFIDGWKLKRNWYWTKECNLIIRKIFSLLKHDVEVKYIAGNHDEFLRDFFKEISFLNMSGLTIGDEFVHSTVNGDLILVVHGDKFDTIIRFAMKYSRFLCFLGDWTYDFLISLNSIVNFFRRLVGYKNNWSLSRYIKYQFKNTISYIGGFEEILSNYAKEKGYKGVICGHIHTPNIRIIKDINYYNTGDWVESCSALIEYEDGEFELFYYDALCDA